MPNGPMDHPGTIDVFHGGCAADDQRHACRQDRAKHGIEQVTPVLLLQDHRYALEAQYISFQDIDRLGAGPWPTHDVDEQGTEV
jgi:hypothetical protein